MSELVTKCERLDIKMPSVTVTATHGRLWDSKPEVTASGFISNIRLKYLNATLTCIAFTAKATSLCGGDNNGSSWVFNVKQNRYSKLGESSSECTCLCTNPVKNEEVAFGYQDGSIKVFSIQGGSHEAEFQGHKFGIRDICFNTCGDKLVSLSKDGVFVWDMQVRLLACSVTSRESLHF